MARAHPADFRSPAGLGQFALLGIVYLFGSSVFSMVAGLRYHRVVGAIIDGSYEGSFQHAIDIENAYAFSGVVKLIGILVIALTWLLWMRRLRLNVVAIGRAPEYRPAWTFWGWTTPIFNYFRPFQVIRDLWRKSDPLPGLGTTGDAPRFYLWWWVSFVVSGQVSRTILRSLEAPDTLEQIQSYVSKALILDLLEIPGFILAVLVVRSLTRRQIAAGAALGKNLI